MEELEVLSSFPELYEISHSSKWVDLPVRATEATPAPMMLLGSTPRQLLEQVEKYPWIKVTWNNSYPLFLSLTWESMH